MPDRYVDPAPHITRTASKIPQETFISVFMLFHLTCTDCLTKFAFSLRAFCFSAPSVWNSPDSTTGTRESQTFSAFKRHHKAHLLHAAAGHHSTTAVCRTRHRSVTVVAWSFCSTQITILEGVMDGTGELLKLRLAAAHRLLVALSGISRIHTPIGYDRPR